ncbi:MBL fold metallo-hydrolase [Halosquirtibacter xylanolyticus]|uniref:MBL fold metallo-hydrolase n=1 Tax=Halosquirtibacter xylanolyticus TaxID=3374599 RepID=UPI003748A8FB|nr:MBL fold metallo-hydrolase [Prolixibacteraceae bacterium]
MKITILIDNTPHPGWISEHGLSLYIETEEIQILFDMGATDGFLHNAKKAGITLTNTTRVLSHGHWDHGNGLIYLQEGKLIAHPSIFTQRFRDKDNSYLGLNMNKADLSKRFDLHLTKLPLWLTDQIVFLGEIPRKRKGKTNFHLEDFSPDNIFDDSAIAIKENNGIHIITGCNHAGIFNLIHHAMNVTESQNIISISGGLHLKEINDELLEYIDLLKKYQNLTLVPLHCTSPIVVNKLMESLHVITPKIGETFHL